MTWQKVATLSQQTFEVQVQPVLQARCASCHQPGGTAPTAGVTRSRLVLTGSAEGDYNVTLSMISDTCHPAKNYLLARPSTLPHPAGAKNQTAALLPTASADYKAIANWIATGCPKP